MGFKIMKTQEEIDDYMERENVSLTDFRNWCYSFYQMDIEKDGFDLRFLDKYNLNLSDEDYKKCKTGKDIMNLPMPKVTYTQMMIDYHVGKKTKLFCSKCNSPIDEEDNYCGRCGHKLK